MVHYLFFAITLLLTSLPQLSANPYAGYYYPSYSRSRRDPSAGQWDQSRQNYGNNGYGAYQQGNLYQQLYPQQAVQPASSDYQTNYRNNRDAVVPPLVPITGNDKADKDLYSQQQSAGYSDTSNHMSQQQMGGLYNAYAGHGMAGQNGAVMQPMPAGAGMYGNELQKPVRLEDYKPSSMDYGQMSKVQQPNYLPHSENNQQAGGLGPQPAGDNVYQPLGPESMGGGHGMFPDAGSSEVPDKCYGVTCDDLTNCIKVDINETECCPKCVKYGCECGDGYQLFDCQQAGYEDGMVPEGDVYYVNQGLTPCFCPLGGGSISCTEKTETCPETPNCIKKFVIPGACDHCLEYGCTDDDGTTYQEGTNVDKPPCELCYCPPYGGDLICGKYPTCVEETESQPKKQVAGFESSIRQIDARGKLDGYTNQGSYPRYGDYGTGYADYGGYMRPDASQTGAGGQSNPELEGQKSNKPIVPGDTSASSTNGDSSVDPKQSPYAQNPYANPYQNPYPNYGAGAGGYLNPYPAYGGGFGSNGYAGYNPYAVPGDPKSLDGSNSESSDTSNEGTDEESNASDNAPEQTQGNVGTNAAANTQGSLASPKNNYQQLYPYYQQQGYDANGAGYAQNPYGNGYGYQPYPGQGSPQATGGEGTDTQPQATGQQGDNTADASSQSGQAAGTNLQPQQNLGTGGYYPYNSYQNFNPSLYNEPTPVGDGENAASEPENPDENNSQNAESEGSPDTDITSSNSKKAKVNSISNPYLDPNYSPQMSNYPQQGNQYNQNPYAGYGYAGYNPYSFGQNTNDPAASKSAKEPSAAGDESASATSQETAANPQGANPNPADPNKVQDPNSLNPYAGYNQQALSGFYPYANQYYTGYNDPYGAGYNMQQYMQLTQNGMLPPNPTKMGDTGSQQPDHVDQQQQTGHLNPQLARPTKDIPIVPGLVPVDADAENREEQQEPRTESPIRKAFLEQADPTNPNKRPSKFLHRLIKTSTEAATTTTRPTTTTTRNPTTTTRPTTTTQTTTTTTTTPKPTATTTTKPTTTPTTTRPATTTTKRTTTLKPTTTTARKTTTTSAATTTTTTREAPRRKIKFPSPSASVPTAVSKVSYENTLTQCCMEGRQWIARYHTCNNIERSEDDHEYSEICLVAKQKCCMDAQSQQFCDKGINTARNFAACDELVTDTCSATQFKTCCDCCALGLKAHGLGYECNVSLFGGPCDTAYKTCCEEGGMQMLGGSHQTGGSVVDGVNPANTRPEVAVPRKPDCANDNVCEQLCHDTSRGMTCSCRRGYKLLRDRRTCTDINECVLNTHNCLSGQLCINKVGGFHCQRRLSCGTGYELTAKNECEDIDECELNLHNCYGNLVCDNNRGSFRCKPKICDDGYFTDATGNCIDFNECVSGDYSCPSQATCINIEGGYKCECGSGYKMDNGACIDIDECLDNPCNKGAKCVNKAGSYRCIEPPKLRCAPGYKPNLLRTVCVDIDECSDGTHTCNEGSTCINERGGFRCQDPLVCKPGFKPSADQHNCIDIDECQDSRKNYCEPGGTCENTPGSWSCSCKEGFSPNMTADGYPTCSDVDECATTVGKICAYKCRNTPGNFECYCPPGYNVGDFGRSCDDIDECALPGTCSGNDTCFNTKGGHKCVQIECPDEYTRHANKCQRKSCRASKERAKCVRLPKQISHHNISLKFNASDDTPIFRMTLARSYRSDKHVFTITEGNEDNSFKVVTSIRGRSPSGVIYTNKSLLGPKEYKIDMTLKLYRRRRWAKFISRVYIFVSAYDFN